MQAMRKQPATASASALTLRDTKIKALMQAAFFEAGRNLGSAWPNPSVGAVIADPKTGELIASAVTAPTGRPHAEVLALQQAGARAKGAVLVTTLEPCSHYGQTPPCADAIVKAGLASVVYGSIDPDPRVSGAGIAHLQGQGVPCFQVLRQQADWLNLGHILRVTAQRPFVQLKLALDAKGLVAPGNGTPVWVTGQKARSASHLLRTHADAIMIGRGTLEADNPQLTCRLPGLENRSPLPVLLTSRPVTPNVFRIFARKSIIVTTQREALSLPTNPPIDLISVPAGKEGKPDLHAALRALAQKGITRLLVEGGPTLAKAFITAGLVDEIIIYKGSHEVAEAKLLPFITDDLALIEKLAPQFTLSSHRNLDGDREIIYRNGNFWRD